METTLITIGLMLAGFSIVMQAIQRMARPVDGGPDRAVHACRWPHNDFAGSTSGLGVLIARSLHDPNART